jgi:membrane-bound serine protease (ClpP class)
LRGKYSFVLRVALLSMMLSLFIGSIHTTHAANGNENASNSLVYVIPIKQTIETGLEKFLQRAFNEAHEVMADHIILDISTFGGRVDAAEAIGSLIRSSSIPTVAYVNGKAISAGSYIALNADQIVMGAGSSIGSAAVVDISGNRIEDSKTVSTWVGLMESAADLNDRNPDYAEKMVDDSVVVTVEEIGKTYEKGDILNFTANEALKAGYAEAVVNNLDEVLAFIEAEDAQVIDVGTTPAENMARFLTNPIVMTVLMLIGMAGIAIELFVPGFGIPGIVGISSFALYFFGHYVAGFAGIEHIFLFIVGVILLVIEIFVPSFGIFGIAGIISLVSGVVLAAYDTERALLSFSIASVLAIIIIVIVSKYFKHRGVWNRFILTDQFNEELGYSSQTSKQHLLGKTGVAVTTLRPSGTASIDDERIDVVTSGEFIAVNQKIIVTRIEGTRVVVREVRP